MAQRLGRCGLASALLRLSAFFLLLAPYVSAQFFQPTKGYEVWTVDDVIDVKYHTTMTNYTIAIWQETRPKNKQGRALPGPVLARTEKGPHTEFKWQVKFYDFDLDTSNVFFFWLKHGGPDNQKNMNAKAMSSHYFRIHRKKAGGGPSKSSTTSTSSTTTVEGLPTAPSSSRSTDTTSPTGTQPPSDNVETPNPDDSDASGGAAGLPVGAQVGIGVGVSVVGLVCIFCAVLWFRYIRKKQRLLAGLEERTTPSESSPPMTDSWKPPVVPPNQPYYYPVVEMDTSRHAAEMQGYQGGSPRSAELPGDNPQWKGFNMDRVK